MFALRQLTMLTINSLIVIYQMQLTIINLLNLFLTFRQAPISKGSRRDSVEFFLVKVSFFSTLGNRSGPPDSSTSFVTPISSKFNPKSICVKIRIFLQVFLLFQNSAELCAKFQNKKYRYSRANQIKIQKESNLLTTLLTPLSI